MKWVPDKTGRFPQRPHYQPAELDAECEKILKDLRRADKAGIYPISTDELEVMIESQVEDLDLYADLASDDKSETQGVTDFFAGAKPRVRISRTLTEDRRRENRLRTTLTHEFGHVKLHGFLVEFAQTMQLFEEQQVREQVSCHRDTILDAPASDWMEWQAAYASGALLMPASAVQGLASDLARSSGHLRSPAVGSAESQKLIAEVQAFFGVSEDAARVRLTRLDLLRVESAPTIPIF